VALYFAMLDKAIVGRPYNKAAMIRTVQFYDLQRTCPAPLSGRSRGSIEAKLMNCSAAHLDVLTAQHTPPIADSVAMANVSQTMHDHGYRCLANYQASLKVAVQHALRERINATSPTVENYTIVAF